MSRKKIKEDILRAIYRTGDWQGHFVNSTAIKDRLEKLWKEQRKLFCKINNIRFCTLLEELVKEAKVECRTIEDCLGEITEYREYRINRWRHNEKIGVHPAFILGQEGGYKNGVQDVYRMVNMIEMAYGAKESVREACDKLRVMMKECTKIVAREADDLLETDEAISAYLESIENG